MMRALRIAALLWLAGCGDCGEETPQGEGCLTCHSGIENEHPEIAAGQCTVCHGGDGEATTLEGAHVPVPSNWAEVYGDDVNLAPEGYIRQFASGQLDQIDADYVRFINPGDVRAADAACGACHPDQVATVKTSIMSTNAGHFMPTRFLAGLQGRDAYLGSYDIDDPHWSGDPGTVAGLEMAVPPPDTTAMEERAYDHYLSKSCTYCHGGSFGKNNARAMYRSSGCTACHMVYNTDGIYEGSDPTISKTSPSHATLHKLTTAIPAEQCATCHFQGGRIGLLFRGIREGGFSPENTPPNAELWNEAVYGHTAGYYVLDEDTTKPGDQTPPDLHYSAGMVCADCHVGSDVHGNGSLYSTSKGQVDLHCEDCHGTVRQARVAEGGVFKTAKGRPLPQLSEGSNGAVVLTRAMDGERVEVPQVATRLAEGSNARMVESMGVSDDGWSHADDVDCVSCHSGWQQFCLVCHVSIDYRASQTDFQTGKSTPGLVKGSRDKYSIDHLLLGTGTNGRAWTVNPSQQVQLTVVDEAGVEQMHKAFRVTEGSDANNGFSPFFQHTTTRNARGCDDCHRSDTSAEELARVRGVYGFGTGEFMLSDDNGKTVDAIQFLAEDGTPLTEWVHPGTGPLAPERIERALGVVLDK